MIGLSTVNYLDNIEILINYEIKINFKLDLLGVTEVTKEMEVTRI